MKVFFALLFIFLFSCRSEVKNKEIFTKDVPFAQDTAYWKRIINEKNNLSDLLGLERLENGTDSFEIRISVGGGIIAGLDIFSIKKDSSGWSGRHFYFQDKTFPREYLGKERFQYQSFNTEVDSLWMGKPFTPLCSWSKFIDSLNYYRLYTIRDQTQIEGCKLGGFDGETAVIELATKISYKYISHWISGNSTCDEFVRFKGFIQMMDRQLGMDYCWPRCWRIEK